MDYYRLGVAFAVGVHYDGGK